MDEFDRTRSRQQWAAEAKSRISRRESGSQVEADFMRRGLDRRTAKAVVNEAVAKLRSRAFGLLIGSGAFAALALFVTLGSYSEAKAHGGAYWIWYGPVVVGGIAALAALARLLSVRR